MGWSFYGRQVELDELRKMLARGRWFFCKLSGRRRIGKTTLVQQALPDGQRSVVYVQIPDSAPSGVVSAFQDALDVFEIPTDGLPQRRDLRSLAQSIGVLADRGTITILDEFQYFSRKPLFDFTSHLQEVVDERSARASEVPGGLIVLGSIHTEMVALLDDRKAPLYSRTTDDIEVGHLDIASVREILRAHTEATPERLLFLWTLFEGVPKFYRDCYEQGVLNEPRRELLKRMFFESSSPLRSEAENWFLHELHGRYDVALKYLARRPGCGHRELQEHITQNSGDNHEQVGGYLKLLTDKFRMVEKRLPILSKPKARKGRYYISDNFLVAWLAALKPSVDAINFRPLEALIERADRQLEITEGHALERLAATLYEERSRKGLAGFSLTQRIAGYWDSGDTEIDLVALDDENEVVRFATIKRDQDRLGGSLEGLRENAARFLKGHARLQSYTQEFAAIAPTLSAEQRAALEGRGFIAQDLADLCDGL